MFLGRLVPEKRPDLLLQAFNKIGRSDWKLVLAGGNSDTTEYISELRALADNNPNIVFAGEIRGRNLAEMVRGAGVFVLPSDLEGLPLAMLEAMREAVPVVASDIPPHQQLIGSEIRGTLFRAGNITSCVAALQKAMHQPQQLTIMAQKAQQYVRDNYTWDKITADNLSVYAQDSNIDLVRNTATASNPEVRDYAVMKAVGVAETSASKSKGLLSGRRNRLAPLVRSLKAKVTQS